MSLRARTALAVLAVLACLTPSFAAAEPPATTLRDRDEFALAALALSLAAAPVPPQAEPERGSAATAEAPRIELVVTLAARSVVFEELPRIRMTFGGPGPRPAVWQVERTNLPARVEPGVEYRDVRVRLTLSSTVDAFESLIEDARRVASGIRMEDAAP